MLEISAIRKDGRTHHRLAVDPSVVQEYASMMLEGVAFAPVRVWFDGESYWLSDGFQRVEAAALAKLSTISAEVWSGSLSDAQWDSYACNGTHGQRRSSR